MQGQQDFTPIQASELPMASEFPIPADSNYLAKCQLDMKKSETDFSRSWLCVCIMKMGLVKMSPKKNTHEKNLFFNESNVKIGITKGHRTKDKEPSSFFWAIFPWTFTVEKSINFYQTQEVPYPG